MPDGRMLNRTVSVSEQLAELRTDTARMLHAWTISHVDRDGLVTADGSLFKARVCPLLDHVTPRVASEVMCDWVRVRLAYAYRDADRQKVLWLCGFRRQQHKSWKYDREAESSFGPPTDHDMQRLFKMGPKLTTAALLRTHSGVAPQWLIEQAGIQVEQLSMLDRSGSIPPSQHSDKEKAPESGPVHTDSGAGQELLTPKVREGNGREGKRSARAHTRTRARAKTGAAGSDQEQCAESSHSEQAEEVLAELRKHEVLRPVATLAMAEQGLCNMAIVGGGIHNVPAVLASVRDLARKAGTAAAHGKPWDEDKLVDRFGAFTSRPPRRTDLGGSDPDGNWAFDTKERQDEAQQEWLQSEERAALGKKAKKAGF